MIWQSLTLCVLFFLLALGLDWKELSASTGRQKKCYSVFMAIAFCLVVASLFGIKLPSVTQGIGKLIGLLPVVGQ